MTVVEIRPKRVAVMLCLAVFAMAAVSLAGQVTKYRFGHDHVFGLVRLTNLAGEANLPTWYSSSALLACAVLLLVVAVASRRRERRYAGHWIGLSAIFALMSLDETAQMHERLNDPLGGMVPDRGIFHFAWVVGGLVFVLVVGLAYLRFVLNLPTHTRRYVILAAALYVGGAVGVEMLGAAHAARHGTEGLGYVGWTTAEELLEMLGVAALIYALLGHLGSHVGPVTFRFAAAAEGEREGRCKVAIPAVVSGSDAARS